MAAASVCFPGASASCLLPLLETCQHQQIDLTQALFKLLLLPWVPECEKFSVHSLRVEFLFPTASGSPKSKSPGLQSQMF